MIQLLIKIFICLTAAGIALYVSVREQNALMELRRSIPPLDKKVRALHEENNRLQYSIDRFENPLHLLELSRLPEYGHLKYPETHDIIVVPKQRSEEL